jgi:double zinc ribbon protein
VATDSSRPGSRLDLRTCAKCSTANDADARFCKSCGEKL